MKKPVQIIIAALVLMFGYQLCSANQTIKVAFGDALPPWVIPETNNGIAIDIIKQSLEPAGYKVKPLFFWYENRLKAYKMGRVDVVSDVNDKIMKNSKIKGYLSVSAYIYENVGVSLKKFGYSFSKINDLVDSYVVSWQGAKFTLGGEYAEMANKNTKYIELPNQLLQVKMLYGQRPIIIHLDKEIFKYYRKKISKNQQYDTNQLIDIFPLFSKNKSCFLFREKKIQVIFDQNFKKLKKSGQYDKIFHKYVK